MIGSPDLDLAPEMFDLVYKGYYDEPRSFLCLLCHNRLDSSEGGFSS